MPEKQPEWGTVNPNYDPMNIYTRSTDGRGQSSYLRAKVPPTIAGQIASLIESKEVPGYRTTADFVRDAIVHRLKYMEDHVIGSDLLSTQIRAEIAMANTYRLQERINQADEQVDALKDVLKRSHESGNRDHLADQVSYAWDVAEGLPEPWKSRVEETAREYEEKL